MNVFAQPHVTPEQEAQLGAAMKAALKSQRRLEKVKKTPEIKIVRKRILEIMSDGRERTAGDLIQKMPQHSRGVIVYALRLMGNSEEIIAERHTGGMCSIYSLPQMAAE